MDEGIFRTIVYYDCLDYPLTSGELSAFSFRNEKGREVGGDLVEISGGFYFLKGRSKLVKIRKERNELARRKWEKTLKAVTWLRLVPYIKLIFASGSLALSNTAQDSDLDVLLVAKHGRIWTTRFFTVLMLGFLGMKRKRGQSVAPDKICLNHFITEKSLYIPRKSIYTAQLYARLVPILGEEKLVEEFCEANSWIKEYIPKFSNKFQIPNLPRKESKALLRGSKFLNSIKNIGEKILDTKFGDWIENVLRKYQLRRIKNYPLTYKPGGRIKADDESLEFHPDSPELKIIERYNKKMIELGFEGLTEKTSFV